MRILVVDDDDQFRSLIRKMLERSGYEVTEAINGEQGVRVFGNKPADLVITDLLMPVMPGTRLISILKGRFPELKIIAISGGGSLHQPYNYLALAEKLGAERVLQKPVLKADLQNAVEAVLRYES